MRRTWLTLLLVVVLVVMAMPAVAQTLPQDFERVLLPIFLPHPIAGAYGTSWSTMSLLFTDSPGAMRVAVGCNEDPRFCDVGPRVSFPLESVSPLDTPSHARFVWVERVQANDARFSSCLRHDDTSIACTPLPVVRESDMRVRIVLPFVPLKSNVRVALRVYGATIDATRIVLRMYRLDRLDPFVDEIVTLDSGTASNDGFHPEPSHYQVLDIVDRWPQLDAATSVRIEITAVDSNARVWAFASVTNNATQEVAVFRP
jgi:hypothetical protein